MDNLGLIAGNGRFPFLLLEAAREYWSALDAAGKGNFAIPVSVLNSYGAIEVSVQSTATTGNYSGVSVLRGSYA